jgi:hypothetical protein
MAMNFALFAANAAGEPAEHGHGGSPAAPKTGESPVANLPALRPDEVERSLVLATSTSLPTFAEGLSDLTAAVKQMNADDVTFEVDASRDRLHVRLRAYRHRS